MKLKDVFGQLLLWPPTSTTVIGAGLLAGVATYEATGSVTLAVTAAGVFKVLCPQDSAAVDKLSEVLGVLGKGVAVLFLAGTLAGCGSIATAVLPPVVVGGGSALATAFLPPPVLPPLPPPIALIPPADAPAATAVAADVEQKIVSACAFSGLFTLVNGTGTSLAPVPGVAVLGQLVDAGIDKVCGDPGLYAGDASTVAWLVKNFKSLIPKLGHPGPAPAIVTLAPAAVKP